MTLDEWRKYYGDETLTEEQITAKLMEQKQKFDEDVQIIVNKYDGLDMNAFINRIGGYEKIEEMKKINEAADKYHVVNGNAVRKTETREDLEEWKRGFMEGFEEAYKRLKNL